MPRLFPILVAGLLVACAGDPTDPPAPARNQLRVINGPAVCDGCTNLEFSVAGPNLSGVADVSLRNHATHVSVATSTEIRNFVGDSGLVLVLRVSFIENTPIGDYDLYLERFGPGGEAGTLMITRAVRVTAAPPGDPGTPPPPPPPGETGQVRVSTTTTGQLPPGQYLVTVDPCDPLYPCAGRYLPPTGMISIALKPGTYAIGLANVPSDCTIAEPRTVVVTVVARGSTDAAFSISCPVPPPPARARMIASVTGPDPDQSFLVVAGQCDYYSYYCYSYQLRAGYPFTFIIAPGTHSVELREVAGNCAVDAPNPRTVTFTSGTTTEVSFAVTCVAAARVHVTAPTSGPDPDQAYLVRLGTCGIEPCTETWLYSGGSVDFVEAPGSYTITLLDVASNCVVTSSNPVTVTPASGAITNVTFPVTCTALPPPPPPGFVRVTAPTTGSNPDTGYDITNESNCDFYYGCFSQPLSATGEVNYPLGAGTYVFRLTGIASNCVVSGANPATVTVVGGATTELVFPVSCH